jgi:hypothetical protein
LGGIGIAGAAFSSVAGKGVAHCEQTVPVISSCPQAGQRIIPLYEMLNNGIPKQVYPVPFSNAMLGKLGREIVLDRSEVRRYDDLEKKPSSPRTRGKRECLK